MSDKPHYTVAHVGVNTESSEEAYALVDQFCYLFNVERRGDKPGNVFAGDIIEVMKHSQRGKHGHIGLRTPDVEAAMADLASKGITFQEDTIRRDENGKIIFIYLQQDVGGFSIHLTI